MNLSNALNVKLRNCKDDNVKFQHKVFIPIFNTQHFNIDHIYVTKFYTSHKILQITRTIYNIINDVT